MPHALRYGRGARGIAALTAALASLGAPAPTAAEERAEVVGASEEVAPRIALLAAREDADRANAVARSLEAQLSDLAIRFEVVWIDAAAPSLEAALALYPAAAGRATACAWVGGAPGGEMILHVADRSWRRLLVRVLPAEDQGAQIAAAALIVRAATQLLLEGGEIGVSTPAPPAPTPAPAPRIEPTPPADSASPREEERRTLFGLEAGYVLGVRSSAAPAIHGISLAAAVSPAEGLVAFAGYTVWIPFAVEAGSAELTVHRHPVLLGAGWGFAVGRLRLGPRIAVAFDTTTTDTALPRDAGPAWGRSTRDFIVSALIDLELKIQLGAGFSLVLFGGVEGVFNRVRYVYRGADGEVAVETPWVIEPRAGVAVELLTR